MLANNLLLIAPEILEEILFLELPAGAQPVGDRALREALCRSVDWREQRRAWDGLKATFQPPGPRSVQAQHPLRSSTTIFGSCWQSPPAASCSRAQESRPCGAELS